MFASGQPGFHCASLQPKCGTRLCGGARLNIFFHTTTEPSPWIEIDLLEPTSISKVLVVNRDDCCEERAVPLLVEVAGDDRLFTQVARETAAFDEVELTFPPTTARYVRLRVNQHSALHLVRTSVYR